MSPAATALPWCCAISSGVLVIAASCRRRPSARCMGVDSDPVARISGRGMLRAPLGRRWRHAARPPTQPLLTLTDHLPDGDTLTGTDPIPAPLFAVLTLARGRHGRRMAGARTAWRWSQN